MSDLTDFSFGRNYRCEILDEIPSAEIAQRHFFPGGLAGGQDGLLLRVTPDGGQSWLGMFAFGKFGPSGISRVLSLPDPDKICVVSRGAGYMVVARDPRSWEVVRAEPIIDVRAVPSAGVVIFANFTDIVAYDADGVRWETERLAWDGLKIIEVSGKSIIGEYFDIRSEALERFEVDLVTGAQRGGVGVEGDPSPGHPARHNILEPIDERHPVIPVLLKQCSRRPPAPDAEISRAEWLLGAPLPADYKELVRESNGLEGFVSPEAYLLLWPVSELPSLNEAYSVSEFLPGVKLIGTDGADTGYGFRVSDGRVEYLSTPLVGMDPVTVKPMGICLDELAACIRGAV